MLSAQSFRKAFSFQLDDSDVAQSPLSDVDGWASADFISLRIVDPGPVHGVIISGTGTDSADVLIGGPSNSSDFNGLEGDDLIISQDPRAIIPAAVNTPNTSFATALDLEQYGLFTLGENPLVADDSVPYQTIWADPNSDGVKLYYRVVVGAGQTITIDVDAGGGSLGTASDTDTVVVLYNGSDLVNPVASNNDSPITAGGFGSVSTRDSFLVYTNPGVQQVFYINILEYLGNFTLETDDDFLLTISVTGRIASPFTSVSHGLNGGGGDDQLIGRSANDFLDGGFGADLMAGGSGNDNYVVDNSGDVVVERSGAGNDRVVATVSYVLGANEYVETLEAQTSGGAINLTGSNTNNTILGNAFANVLSGQAGDDLLDGGAGVDTMYGGLGDDTFLVDNVGDVVIEASGEGFDRVLATVSYVLGAGQDVEVLAADSASAPINLTGNDLGQIISGSSVVNVLTGGADADTFYGLGGNDQIFGLGGNDYIDGGAGADTLAGGQGDDVYQVDNAGDVIIEGFGGGYDTVFAIFDYLLSDDIERVAVGGGTGSTYAINLTGNIRANELSGNNGVNQINGGAGADLMTGYGGNDIYIVDNIGDVVIEGLSQGLDTIFTSVSFTLEHDIERLGVNGFGTTYAINLTGNELANEMWGNDGANVIDGRAGADIMTGFGGNDIYFIDNAGDVINESGIGGYDTVFAGFSYVLSDDLERVAVNGGAATTFAIDLTGNARNNEISGNDGANVLAGQGGSDLLIGYGGADTFAFTSSIYVGSIDQIADFQVGLDKIGLDDGEFAGLTVGALAAGAFRIGNAAQDADDRIIYDSTTGALYFDADGNGAGTQVQFANLSNGLALSASDFQVI